MLPSRCYENEDFKGSHWNAFAHKPLDCTNDVEDALQQARLHHTRRDRLRFSLFSDRLSACKHLASNSLLGILTVAMHLLTDVMFISRDKHTEVRPPGLQHKNKQRRCRERVRWLTAGSSRESRLRVIKGKSLCTFWKP